LPEKKQLAISTQPLAFGLSISAWLLAISLWPLVSRTGSAFLAFSRLRHSTDSHILDPVPIRLIRLSVVRFCSFLISGYQRKSAAKGLVFPDPRSSALIRGKAFDLLS